MDFNNDFLRNIIKIKSSLVFFYISFVNLISWHVIRLCVFFITCSLYSFSVPNVHIMCTVFSITIIVYSFSILEQLPESWRFVHKIEHYNPSFHPHFPNSSFSSYNLFFLTSHLIKVASPSDKTLEFLNYSHQLLSSPMELHWACPKPSLKLKICSIRMLYRYANSRMQFFQFKWWFCR